MLDAATLHQAAAYLAGRCDGAQSLDGQGFAAPDVRLGHTLAALPPERWTHDLAASAHVLLWQYRRQLESAGFDLDWQSRPQVDRQEARSTLAEHRLTVVRHTSDGFTLEGIGMPPHYVLGAIKGIPGRRWDPERKVWTAPDTDEARRAVRAILDTYPAEVVAETPIPEPSPDSERLQYPPGVFLVELSDDRSRVIFRSESFPGWDAIGAVKSLPARSFDGESKTWSAPLTDPGRLLELLAREDFYPLGDVAAVLAEAVASRSETLDASRSAGADFHPRGLSPGAELMPFQRAGVAYALRVGGNTFIADEPGLGKTWEAIAYAAHTGSWPMLVVSPATVKIAWQRTIEQATGREAAILRGTKALFLPEADAWVMNYEIVHAWRQRIYAAPPKLLVIDESHKVKNPKAQRTKALAQIAKKTREAGGTVLLLTGTPIVNAPHELISQLRIIDRLDELGGWSGFTSRYCVRSSWGGFERGGRHLDELNERLRARCFVRRRKVDVLTELPPKTWTAVPIELSRAAMREYQAEEDRLARWAQEQKRKAHRGEETAGNAEALVQIAKLRQAAARAKMPDVEAWITDFLESGEKLVLFAHHRSVTETLAAKLEAPAIIGGISDAERQAAVDRFQTDPECRVIVCSISAASVGLTLTAASNVAFVESGWTPADMDQASDRCHRIGQDSPVTAWTLDAVGTIDDWIAELIATKRLTVDAATEGATRQSDTRAILDRLTAGRSEE